MPSRVYTLDDPEIEVTFVGGMDHNFTVYVPEGLEGKVAIDVHHPRWLKLIPPLWKSTRLSIHVMFRGKSIKNVWVTVQRKQARKEGEGRTAYYPPRFITNANNIENVTLQMQDGVTSSIDTVLRPSPRTVPFLYADNWNNRIHRCVNVRLLSPDRALSEESCLRTRMDRFYLQSPVDDPDYRPERTGHGLIIRRN